MQCVLFILVIHSRGFASVPIKVAMMPPRKMPSIKDPMAVLNNWPLGAGLFHCCRMASFYTLRHSDSSSFMLRPPILTSGVIAGAALLSVVMFRETLTLMTVAGILLIITGVLLISVSHQ